MIANRFDRIFVMVVFVALAANIFVSSASAFGASSDYWDENPLMLEPGTSQDIQIRLQNLAGTSEDVVLRANIQEGGEIATLVDENNDYVVPFGTENIVVNIAVEIPEDAEPGKVYDVLISFDQIASPDESFLQLASAIKKKIPVQVAEKENFFSPSNSSRNSTILVIVVLAVLALAVGLLLYSRRRKIKRDIREYN